MPSGIYDRSKSKVNNGIFKKGAQAWNKDGKIDREKYPNMGHFSEHTVETKKKMRDNHNKFWLGKKHSEESKDKLRHEKSYAWKGEKAGYGSIHDWVRHHKGEPSHCELCGTTEIRRYHWANVDHKYKRILNDYFRACVPCHKKYDKENN